MNLLLRFHPFYVPVHRSTVGAVNSLLNAALHSHNTDITKMNKDQALAAIAGAITAIRASKLRNAALQAELLALRDTCAGHDAIVTALNTQINSLVEEDAAIDAALESLGAETAQPATETPPADPVTPPVPEPEPEQPADPADPAAPTP